MTHLTTFSIRCIVTPMDCGAEDVLAHAEVHADAMWMQASGSAIDAVDLDMRAYRSYARAFEGFVDAGQAEQAARFIAALRDFWWARERCREGLDWAERVIALPQLSELSRAKVLDHIAALAFSDGQHTVARDAIEASLTLRRLHGSPRELALTFNHLAAILR